MGYNRLNLYSEQEIGLDFNIRDRLNIIEVKQYDSMGLLFKLFIDGEPYIHDEDTVTGYLLRVQPPDNKLGVTYLCRNPCHNFYEGNQNVGIEDSGTFTLPSWQDGDTPNLYAILTPEATKWAGLAYADITVFRFNSSAATEWETMETSPVDTSALNRLISEKSFYVSTQPFIIKVIPAPFRTISLQNNGSFYLPKTINQIEISA